MVSVSTTAIVGLALFAVCVSGAVPLSVGTLPPEGSKEASITVGTFSQQDPNNSSATERHHNKPNQTNGDVDSIQQWLVQQLTNRLSVSASLIEGENYDSAREALSNQYRDDLRRYADIAEDTQNTQDDRISKGFDQVGTNQRKFAALVAEYRETYEVYQNAKQEGNSSRVRDSARELNVTQADINTTASDLLRDYNQNLALLDNNFSKEKQIIKDITQEIHNKQASIQKEEFVETKLTVRSTSTNISFRDPLNVRGRLTLRNGTPVSNRIIRFQVGEQELYARTDQFGEYRFRYRPAYIPAGEQSLDIQYLPSGYQPYFGSESTLDVNVTKVTPTISITESPNRTRFNDSITVSGIVGVSGHKINNSKLAVVLGGRYVGMTRTNESGAFTHKVTVPADANGGEEHVRISLPLNGRALSSTNVTVPITIERTATMLSVNGEQSDRQEITVSGQLRTVNGTAVENQEVTVFVNGTKVGTTTTNVSGHYRTVVTVPPRFIENTQNRRTVELSVRYPAEGSNLESDRRTVSVELRFGSPNGQFGLSEVIQTLFTTLPWLWIAFAGAMGIIAIGVLLSRSGADSTPSVSEGQRSDPEALTENGGETTRREVSLIFDIANEQLANNQYENAIQAAYAAVYLSIARELSPPSTLTPWEFYQLYAWQSDSERATALERLTKLYEQTTFSGKPASPEAAREAVETANAFRNDREE